MAIEDYPVIAREVDEFEILQQVDPNDALSSHAAGGATQAEQRYRAQNIVNWIAEELAGRRQAVLERRAALVGELSIVNAELDVIDRSYGIDTARFELPGNKEVLEGQVTLDDYNNVLQPYGYGSIVIKNNWKSMIKTALRLRNPAVMHRGILDICPLPEPQNVELDNRGRITNLTEVTIDTSAFATATEFIRSHGEHFVDHLRGIQALLGRHQPEYHYRTFIMWSDFVSHTTWGERQIETVSRISEKTHNVDEETASARPRNDEKRNGHIEAPDIDTFQVDLESPYVANEAEDGNVVGLASRRVIRKFLMEKQGMKDTVARQSMGAMGSAINSAKIHESGSANIRGINSYYPEDRARGRQVEVWDPKDLLELVHAYKEKRVSGPIGHITIWRIAAYLREIQKKPD